MQKKRNSIIELLRFFFAMNVVKNHGFFPYQGGLFSPGRISVEFFFVLSGFLFAYSITKYNNKSIFADVFKLYKDKLIALGLPLIVGLCFNIFYIIALGTNKFSIWGYLWYVHDMLIVFATYLVLRKIIKSDQAFWGIIVIIAIITSVLHAEESCYTWGYFRAFPAIAFGMLLTKIPKLKNKFVVWLGFTIVCLAVLRMLLFDFTILQDELLNVLLYPALIYFAFQIECSNKIFDYLGSLSFGLYAFQSIPRFMREINSGNIWIYFIIIICCSVVADLIKRLIRYFCSSKKTKAQAEQSSR